MSVNGKNMVTGTSIYVILLFKYIFLVLSKNSLNYYTYFRKQDVEFYVILLLK